jgi:threonine dehydrogenase-like Zn-dependent dehydrogenase
VSGNPRALQAALDLTGRGGRVVLGSWYGSEAAALTLGLAFHRSHLSIKCSQVREFSIRQHTSAYVSIRHPPQSSLYQVFAGEGAAGALNRASMQS